MENAAVEKAWVVQSTQRLRVHDERMRAGGRPGVADLDEDAVALIVILAVTVRLLQQRLRVADLTADAAAGHRLEVGARSQRLRAELLTDTRGGGGSLNARSPCRNQTTDG